MRPVPAIVETDVAAHAVAVDKAMREYRDAGRHYEEAERRATTARNVLAERRLVLGRALIAARKCWPTSGPRAKGWGDFLKVRALDPDVALDAMKYAGYVDEKFPGILPGELPSRLEAGLDQHLEPVLRDTKPVNGNGGSGDPVRGTYCTPAKYAAAVGPWDLDPFSNPRSHVVADVRCMLENGGDGLVDPEQPGSCRWGGEQPGHSVAEPDWRVWIQPPYERGLIERVVAHYGHTRFCALLRWAPDTGWFAALWPLVRVVAFPIERIAFETPDGIQFEGADEDEDRGAPYPHAFYYADERDVTDEIRRLCIVLRVEHGPNT